jgi:ubiquitin-conjugating enzyme E2 S
LLIYPNPESALNEEAGKLLLEDYEAYFKHAKLMTSIHASKNTVTVESSKAVLTPSVTGNISPQKRSMVQEEEEKKASIKKKGIKRL